MSHINGYTNHLLNVFNGVLKQIGDEPVSIYIRIEVKSGFGEDPMAVFSKEEHLQTWLDNQADTLAHEEAERRVGKTGYEPVVQDEYKHIMEMAKK